MANKDHYYGLVKRGDIESRTFGGTSLTNLDALTKIDVYTAIRILLQENPNFDKLSANVAAQRVADKIEDMGFRGNLSVNGGTITDGTTYIGLTHGTYDGQSIITAHEKKK